MKNCQNSLFQLTNAINKKRKIFPPLKTLAGDIAFSDEDKANALANTFLNCHKISINSHSPYALVIDRHCQQCFDQLLAY